MTATVAPATLTAPAWAVIYDGAGGAKAGSVSWSGGVSAVVLVGGAEPPAAGAAGLLVSQGVAVNVAVGALEKLYGRAYGTADNAAVAVVVFSPAA